MITPFRALWPRPFDIRTEEGRALERDRLQAVSVLSNLVARTLALVALVLASRIALADLGSERFGLWTTIVSFLSLITFLDMGIGNGLVAPIAMASARDERDELRNLITRGVALSLILGAVAGLLLISIASLAPLRWLFHDISPEREGECRSALQCFGALCALWIPNQTVTRILVGLQRAYISYIGGAICSVITCTLLLTLGGSGLSVTQYILISFGMSLVAVLPAVLFLTKGGHLRRPQRHDFHKSNLGGLLSSGGLFLALQLGVLFGWGMDQAIISALIGPAAVAPYAIAARIYMLVSQPFYVINAPLWSSYAHAIGSGDRAYLRRKFIKSMSLTIGGSLFGVVVVLALGEPIWNVFTGAKIAYPLSMMVAFSIWTVLECSGNALSMLLNAAHLLKEQLFVVVVLVAIALPAKFVLIGHYGSTAAPIATIIAYLLPVVALYGLVFRRRILALFN